MFQSVRLQNAKILHLNKCLFQCQSHRDFSRAFFLHPRKHLYIFYNIFIGQKIGEKEKEKLARVGKNRSEESEKREKREIEIGKIERGE